MFTCSSIEYWSTSGTFWFSIQSRARVVLFRGLLLPFVPLCQDFCRVCMRMYLSGVGDRQLNVHLACLHLSGSGCARMWVAVGGRGCGYLPTYYLLRSDI